MTSTISRIFMAMFSLSLLATLASAHSHWTVHIQCSNVAPDRISTESQLSADRQCIYVGFAEATEKDKDGRIQYKTLEGLFKITSLSPTNEDGMMIETSPYSVHRVPSWSGFHKGGKWREYLSPDQKWFVYVFQLSLRNSVLRIYIPAEYENRMWNAIELLGRKPGETIIIK